MNPAEQSWAAVEFQYANLGDLRRQNRLVQLAEQRGDYPNASIPQACGDAAATKAAYRFYNNDDIPEGEILASHRIATQHRLAQEEIVLAVGDTTVIDYTHHPHKTGLGVLSDEKHHGLFLHTTLAITPPRVPLGIIDQLAWTRSPDEFGKSHQRRSGPIEEKESHRWLDSLEATSDMQAQLPDTHLINVGDREADIYDLFQKAVSEEISLLTKSRLESENISPPSLPLALSRKSKHCRYRHDYGAQKSTTASTFCGFDTAVCPGHAASPQASAQ